MDEIYSRNTFEHVEKFMELMEEIWRVCKNGAKIRVIVPYFAHPGAFQDPTHKRFFSLRTFDYFTKESNFNFYSLARFKVLSKKLTFFVLRKRTSSFFDFFISGNLKIYERFFSRIFPAEELEIFLEVVKKK